MNQPKIIVFYFYKKLIKQLKYGFYLCLSCFINYLLQVSFYISLYYTDINQCFYSKKYFYIFKKCKQNEYYCRNQRFIQFKTLNMKLLTKFLSVILFLTLSFSVVIAQDDLLEEAKMYYDMQAFNESIDAYLEVFQTKTGTVDNYAQVADAYRRTNKMEKAAEYYGKAINTGSAQPEVFYQYGLVLKALARYTEAIEWFKSYANASKQKGNHFAESCTFAIKQSQSEPSFKTYKELINTSQADFGPAFYGDKLVYSSSRTDIKNPALSGNANFSGETISQTFIANMSRKGVLSRPKLLLTGIQAKTDVGPVTFSSDKKTVYYTENNFQDGIRWIGFNGLVLSLNSGRVDNNNAWVDTDALPFNSGSYSVAYPTLSSDGKELYFASDMPEGYGGFDIYVSKRQGGTWSKPENLGAEVNTAGDEITPYILGNVLYFSSNWHWGLGGFDIFSAKKTRNSWGSISHLGKDINSTRDDIGFIFNPKKKTGYFSSNRLGGKGDLDIYRVTPTKSAPKPIADVQPPSNNNNNNNSGGNQVGNGKDQVITLKVLDGSNSQPINNVTLDFADCGAKKFYTNFNGVYEFRALAGTNCNVVLTKTGYLNKTINLRTNNQDYRTIEVTLDPTEEGFAGFVLDGTNQSPIVNARISAIDAATNQELKAITNNLGRYVLSLQPFKTYNITVSKAGYVQGTLSLNTMDGSNKNILGKERLQRSATWVNPTQIADAGGSEEAVNWTARGITEVYAIQIGVFRNPDITQLQALKEFGNVFAESVGDLQKYKVGSYKTKAEAQKVKNLIVQKTGMYQDAWIAKINDGETINQTYISSDIPGGASKPKPTASGGSAEAVPPGMSYKVQLGVYSKPEYFERSKYSDLGPIQTTTKVVNGKNLTVFLLGNYRSKSDAEKVKEIVKSRGLPNAFLVAYKNGRPVK